MKLESRRGHGDREGQRVGIGARRERGARVHEELVRERGEGGEDARAAHHDAARGVLHLVQGYLVARGGHVAARLVDGGLHDGVGEREIAPGHLLVKGDQVGRAARVAVDRPLVGSAREARHRGVEIVRRAAHDAHAVFCDALEARVPPHEVLARARNDVADVDEFARLGIGHQADVGRLVLQVEEGGHGARRAREGRVGGDVAHALAAHPDLAVVLQTLEKLLARACHGRRATIVADRPCPVKVARLWQPTDDRTV